MSHHNIYVVHDLLEVSVSKGTLDLVADGTTLGRSNIFL